VCERRLWGTCDRINLRLENKYNLYRIERFWLVVSNYKYTLVLSPLVSFLPRSKVGSGLAGLTNLGAGLDIA